jgi:hypothetical protein
MKQLPKIRKLMAPEADISIAVRRVLSQTGSVSGLCRLDLDTGMLRGSQLRQSIDLAGAKSRYRILVGYCKMSHSSSPKRPSFVSHPLCPPLLRQLVEDTVQSFDDAWLLPPQNGELFDSGKACLDLEGKLVEA